MKITHYCEVNHPDIVLVALELIAGKYNIEIPYLEWSRGGDVEIKTMTHQIEISRFESLVSGGEYVVLQTMTV